MKVVRAARPSTAASCRRWGALPVSSPASGPSNATVDHYQALVRTEPGRSAASTFERLREQLFAYDIFPRWFMHSAICPVGRITEGATIVQRVVFGPLALEMAVRVTAVWDERDGRRCEAGFTYATIVGHAECGVETFRVRLDDDGQVTVLIDARSRPGSRLTRLGRPVARLLQRSMTQAALRRWCDSRRE